jgi:hypothetical protein
MACHEDIDIRLRNLIFLIFKMERSKARRADKTVPKKSRGRYITAPESNILNIQNGEIKGQTGK